MPSPVYLLDTDVVLHLVRGRAVGKELAAAFGLLNSVNRPPRQHCDPRRIALAGRAKQLGC